MQRKEMIQASLLLDGGYTRNPPDYREIMESYSRYVVEERPRLSGPKDVVELMRPILSHKQQEEVHALLLDTKHRLIKDVIVSVGLIDRSPIHPRETFRPAIQYSATRVILVHQHPSGDPTPSSQDVESTKVLLAASRIIGIEVMDHVIVGKRTDSRPKDYISFREEGLLNCEEGGEADADTCPKASYQD